MIFWWYFGLIGCVCVGISYCQDDDSLLIDPESESDAIVKLSIETQPKSAVETTNNDSPQNQLSEPFICHECTNCDSKSELPTRPCDVGVNMCYKEERHLNNKTHIIHRGCSTSKGQCTAPNHDQSNLFGSVICCPSPKCNQGIQLNPLFFLSMIAFIIII